MVIIGWDISTSVIGICVKRDGKNHEFDVIIPRGDTPLQKWRSAVEEVKNFMVFLDRESPIHHIIEQRLGGFTGGLTTKQTLMSLAAMNAVVSHQLSLTGDVTYILPITAKSIMGLKKLQIEGEDKKETVVRLARSSCPDFPYFEKKKQPLGKKPPKGKVYPWVSGVDDMADAWLLVEAGTKVLNGEASIGQPKKTPSSKSKAGRAEVDSSAQGGVRLHVPGEAGDGGLPKRKSRKSKAVGQP